ncbi:MAG: pimB 1 [Actinomycetia bacterium]|nr:pimB 1 [Actinomycetes bacterium]
MTSTERLLWVGVEPTPYLLRVQEAVAERLGIEVDAVFEGRERSQPWGLGVDEAVVVGRSPRARVRFVLQLLVRPPDVLLVEGWSTPSALVALVVGRIRRRRRFVSSDTWRATGGSGLRSLGRSLVVRSLVRTAEGVLVAGTPQGEHLVAAGVDPERVHRLPMVVDIDAIAGAVRADGARSRARATLAVDGFTVLYVGRLVPGKGVEATLAALDRMPLGTTGLFVGEGPLGDRVARSDRARRLGRRTGADLWSCFAAADVLVLPSEAEAWGLVVNEAAAAGIPVVVSDGVGSAPDLIGDPARVVPVGDVDGLAAAMARLADPTTAARAVAEQDQRLCGFTLDVAVQALGDVLRGDR